MSCRNSDRVNKKELFDQSGISGKVALILATWFGAGLVPFAPGTFGTLGALPLALALSYCPLTFRILLVFVFLATAIWASGRAESLLGKPDSPEIVVDEVTGFLVASFLLKASWLDVGLAFVLFRVFDILKPFPVGLLDRRLRGGLGIVMDDLAAGCYTLGAVEIIRCFLR